MNFVINSFHINSFKQTLINFILKNFNLFVCFVMNNFYNSNFKLNLELGFFNVKNFIYCYFLRY